MHLVYIDEVKYDPIQEPFYWLFGLAIDESDIDSVEDAMNGISRSYFGKSILDASNEFHGVQIVQGKGPYKGHDLTKRTELFKELTNVVESHPRVGRVMIQLDPTKMQGMDVQRVAFMFMVERVEQMMRARKSKALLILDHDKQFTNANVRGLSSFKEAGTDFAFGQKILNVVDTVHHTQSNHSRLLQLTDIYAYSIALQEKKPQGYPKSEIVRHIGTHQNYCWPTKYKIWPK